MKKTILLSFSMLCAAFSLSAQANSFGELILSGTRGSGLSALEMAAKDLAPATTSKLFFPTLNMKRMFYYDPDLAFENLISQVKVQRHDYRRMKQNLWENRNNPAERAFWEKKTNDSYRTLTHMKDGVNDVVRKYHNGTAGWIQDIPHIAQINYNVIQKYGENIFKYDETLALDFAEQSAFALEVPHLHPEISLGNLPGIYELLGLPPLPLETSALTLRKATGQITEEEQLLYPDRHNHNVPLDVIENLVRLVADPVAVYESTAIPGSLVAVLDYTVKGKPVLVPIRFAAGSPKLFIPTLFESARFNDLIKWNIYHRKVLYVDVDRQTWITRKIEKIFDESGISMATVLTKKDIARAIVWTRLMPPPTGQPAAKP